MERLALSAFCGDMQCRADLLRQKAKLARRLMTATDDRLTLHELKTFARECEEEANRIKAREEVQALLTKRATPIH